MFERLLKKSWNSGEKAPAISTDKGPRTLLTGVLKHLRFVFAREMRKGREGYGPQVVSAACAAVGYLIAYSFKNYFYTGMFIQGFTTAAQCWAVVVAKLPTTLFNGALAVIFAPILGVALLKALKAAHLDRMLA